MIENSENSEDNSEEEFIQLISDECKKEKEEQSYISDILDNKRLISEIFQKKWYKCVEYMIDNKIIDSEHVNYVLSKCFENDLYEFCDKILDSYEDTNLGLIELIEKENIEYLDKYLTNKRKVDYFIFLCSISDHGSFELFKYMLKKDFIEFTIDKIKYVFKILIENYETLKFIYFYNLIKTKLSKKEKESLHGFFLGYLLCDNLRDEKMTGLLKIIVNIH